jgi:methylthioribulose-1-phosphate dehydratase
MPAPQPHPTHDLTALIHAGQLLHDRGWVPATSGNFSLRLDPERFAITVSGRHKGRLTPADLMEVDAAGRALDTRTPSAETMLHVQLYQRYADTNVVLHTHSVNATVISRLASGEIVLTGYELLKAFPDIESHEARVVVPVFPNDQDIPRLARVVDNHLDARPTTFGYLIAGHGLYTWGTSVETALRQVEAFEFLFECELKMRGATIK